MPQTVELAVFVLGGVLLLMALSAGSFKIFGAEMSGASGRFSRMAAGVAGAGLIVAGIVLGSQPHDQQAAAAKTSVDVGHPDAATASTGDGTPAKENAATVPIRAPAVQAPVASAPAPAPTTPKPMAVTQPIKVECNSLGQDCDRSADITGPFPAFLTIRSAAGCSDVIYTVHFLHRGNGFAAEEVSAVTTKPLGSEDFEVVRVDPRATSAKISAKGVRGGCNEGRLGGWHILVEPGSN